MGILNVTPDSFSDGGRFEGPEAAVAAAVAMVADGATIVDVGGESTRPGAAAVSADEECDRVVPVVRGIREESDVVISIDTTKATVAREALTAGADIVNDVSGLTFDRDLAAVTAELGAGLCVMHTPARPDAMMEHADYDDVVGTVRDALAASIARARDAGIPDDAIVTDPGFGFGKRRDENYTLLRRLDALTSLGHPVLIGLSRKRMLRDVVGTDPWTVEHATTAAHVLAILGGASVLRVHDVRAAAAAVAVADAWDARRGHPPE